MTTHNPDIPARRFVELVTERTVERFLLRLFLRESRLRTLCIVSPFVGPLQRCRFCLADLRAKVEREKIPTYVITREPIEAYQHEAMAAIGGSPWIELRYNASIHAKLYVATAEREADSFALFGSGNLTTPSIESNIELGMLVYGEGAGRGLLHQLHYWANVRLRTLTESRLIQPIKAKRN
jgi:phosphatidylserine/phosphatidylglycerophosphate/cardiolipin synthase-like enzyme